jgi:hypothetical protein
MHEDVILGEFKNGPSSKWFEHVASVPQNLQMSSHTSNCSGKWLVAKCGLCGLAPSCASSEFWTRLSDLPCIKVGTSYCGMKM